MLLGRYATDWLRRKPIRPSASLSSLACRPLSSVNTFRSTLPGRYGHGLGFVTKNFGKRNGALTPALSNGYATLYAAGKRRRKGLRRTLAPRIRPLSRKETGKYRLFD